MKHIRLEQKNIKWNNATFLQMNDENQRNNVRKSSAKEVSFGEGT